MKNNEIHSFEVANRGSGIVTSFLHTRSFNILRRSGIGVKEKVLKTNDFQNFSMVL